MLKVLTLSSMVRRLLVLAGVTILLAIPVSGCVAGADVPDSEDAPALSQQSAEQTNVVCDQSGFWFCPSTNLEWEYSIPGCLAATWLQAKNGCNNNCVAACIDSGWMRAESRRPLDPFAGRREEDVGCERMTSGRDGPSESWPVPLQPWCSGERVIRFMG